MKIEHISEEKNFFGVCNNHDPSHITRSLHFSKNANQERKILSYRSIDNHAEDDHATAFPTTTLLLYLFVSSSVDLTFNV